ncbi:hypothetical protein L7F22_044843 [Adiantum nelumboides]|nr:hypothetical protein [Adiantum nelumboides]
MRRYAWPPYKCQHNPQHEHHHSRRNPLQPLPEGGPAAARFLFFFFSPPLLVTMIAVDCRGMNDEIISRSCDYHNEAEAYQCQKQAVQTQPLPLPERLILGEVLILHYVLDGGYGEGEALRELDTAHHRQGHEALHKAHEAGDAQKKEEARRAEARGHDLGHREMVALSERYGGNGLHGLHRHGHAKEQARQDVVDAGEDESGAQIEARYKRESDDDGNEGAQIAESPACFHP